MRTPETAPRFTLRLAAAAACVAGVSVLGGCDGGDRAVPFKRPQTDAPEAAASAAPAPGSDPLTPRDGLAFAEPTARVELAGAAFDAPAASLLSALDVDLDHDGDRDLLLVDAGADAAHPTLQAAMRTPEGWSPPRLFADLGRDDCRLTGAALRLLGAGYALASLEQRCQGPAPSAAPSDEPPQPQEPASLEPPPPDPPSPTEPAGPQAEALERPFDSPFRAQAIIALEATPRVVLQLRTPLQQAGPAEVTPKFESTAIDADEHPDLKLTLEVKPPLPLEPLTLSLSWLNRPSGLAFESDEPEASIQQLANQAKQLRKGAPEAARAAAERAMAVHDALCRQSGEAVLEIDGVAGLPCPASLGAGRALSVLLAVAAREGKLLEALGDNARLERSAFRLTDNDRDRIYYAFQALSEGGALDWTRGPSVPSGAAPKVRLSRLAFLDEQHVLIRGDRAMSYQLGESALSPIGLDAGLAVTDPAHRFAVRALTRECDGYHLELVSASQIVAGLVAGPLRASPRVLAAAPPEQAQGACPGTLPPSLRRDDGGFRVLGWGPSGVLLQRGISLMLLPIAADGSAAAPARVLGNEQAPPPIAHLSALDKSGQKLLLETSHGLAVVERASGRARLITPPRGSGPVEDAAISPSGRRIALLRDGTLWIGGEPRKAAAPASDPDEG